MRPARRWRGGTWVAAAAAVAVIVVGCGGSGDPPATGAARARAVGDAEAFLHRYVSADGRVIRHDQGGDSVSEGQGYGLLLSYAVGDRQLFARIWDWTSANLQRPDGLLGFHWAAGHLVDTTPAADADVQVAWALDLAGARWSSPADTAAARRIAGAVASKEIGYDDQGHPTLAAGPWAVRPGQPVSVEPGYWTYPADRALAALTDDNRWRQLAASDIAHLRALTDDGRVLPADWAALGSGSKPEPVALTAGSQARQSGQDGLRALVWSDCTPAGRRLAAAWWPMIAATARAGPLTRSLSGEPLDTSVSPLSQVAAAAAAAATGHRATAVALLDDADRVLRRYPTYYGSAWVALGRVLLTTDLLPGCGGPAAGG